MISKATEARSIIEIDKACTVSAFLYQLIAVIEIIYAILSATLSKTVIRKGIIIKGFELSHSVLLELYHNSIILSIKRGQASLSSNNQLLFLGFVNNKISIKTFQNLFPYTIIALFCYF